MAAKFSRPGRLRASVNGAYERGRQLRRPIRVLSRMPHDDARAIPYLDAEAVAGKAGPPMTDNSQ
jgi:hypothetical protein